MLTLESSRSTLRSNGTKRRPAVTDDSPMVMNRTSSHPLTWLVCLLALCCPVTLQAQGQTPPAQSAGAQPPTAEQMRSLHQAAVSDMRVRAIVGPGETRAFIAEMEPDKAAVEAFLSGTSAAAPARPTVVTVFNPATNKAARTLMAGGENRVVAVRSVSPSDVPFGRDDATQALELAKSNPDVRRIVGQALDQFEILDPGSEARVAYAAQALPLRSTNPRDACSVNRCVDLIFRTENGYLSLRAHVDLTKRTVTISQPRPHR
jgi:hypothetical protein